MSSHISFSALVIDIIIHVCSFPADVSEKVNTERGYEYMVSLWNFMCSSSSAILMYCGIWIEHWKYRSCCASDMMIMQVLDENCGYQHHCWPRLLADWLHYYYGLHHAEPTYSTLKFQTLNLQSFNSIHFIFHRKQHENNTNILTTSNICKSIFKLT